YHPEAEHRQKAEKTKEHQERAQQDTQQWRFRQRDAPLPEHDLTRLRINPEMRLLPVFIHHSLSGIFSHNWGLLHSLATELVIFFEKSAWQIRKACVLAASLLKRTAQQRRG
ncbi:MAG: hypothetical protein AAAB14_10075, partial [Ensifer adhaerens]